MTDGDAIFDDQFPTTTEGVSPEAPEQSGVVRDEAGRFAPRDTGDTEQSEAAPPAAVEKETHSIPLSAVLDERERRQKAEARLALLERQLAAQQQQPQLPDPIEDVQGYTQHVTSVFQQSLLANKLQQSEFLAREKFGDELIDEAMAFIDNDPEENGSRFLNSPSPYHAMVAWYQAEKVKRERAAPDFEEKLRAKIRAELEAEMRSAAPQRPSPAIRPSLATATGSRGAPPVQSGDPLFD